MTKDNVKEKYETVGGLLEDAIRKTEEVEVAGEEENAELSAIISTLKGINDDFKQEIIKLENSSEWDKFCIAFFGETNAGKSTIIESLRIIYDEEQRRLEKEKIEEEYERTLLNHCENFKELLSVLQETNNLIINKKEQNKIGVMIKNICLLVLGVCIGAVIAYFGF